MTTKNGNRDTWLAELRAGVKGRFTSTAAALVWNVEISTARFRLRALLRRASIAVVEQTDRWAFRQFIIAG